MPITLLGVVCNALAARTAFAAPSKAASLPATVLPATGLPTASLTAVLLTAVLLTAALLTPAPATAQSLPDLLGAIAQGGGWITIPIEEGRGVLRTRAVPTAGLRLSGCMQIWGGHSGAFDVAVEDVYGNGSLRRDRARPAEDVPFDYRPGAWSQLDVDVRWTEARDTTLMVWVGLEGGRRSTRDPCEPVYGSSP